MTPSRQQRTRVLGVSEIIVSYSRGEITRAKAEEMLRRIVAAGAAVQLLDAADAFCTGTQREMRA